MSQGIEDNAYDFYTDDDDIKKLAAQRFPKSLLIYENNFNIREKIDLAADYSTRVICIAFIRILLYIHFFGMQRYHQFLLPNIR